MFNWEGCPIGLFDLYMDVAAVKVAESGEDFVCIELWIPDRYAETHRPECEGVARRPIYGVVRQLRKLSAGKGIFLLIMGDDIPSRHRIDPESWFGALSPLLKELKNSGDLKGCALFTSKSRDEILLRRCGDFRTEKDQDTYNALFDRLDILVTGQPNRYVSPKNREITGISPALLPLLSPA